MQILVKIPTRERPAAFAEAFNGYVENQTTANVHYLVSLDNNDHTMAASYEALKDRPDVTVILGNSQGKIHACNRDMSAYTKPWDILVLCSDDMHAIKKGWDEQLIAEFAEHYPDTDGVIWHNDGHVGNKLNTLCILGKAYYNRFNYIYHPSYISLWSDNEFTEVADMLGKQTYFNEVLFKHNHPINLGEIEDKLYNRNNKFYWRDKQNYDTRKKQRFGIKHTGANTTEQAAQV